MSYWMTERQRKDAIKQAKLDQERSYAEHIKLERMSKHDPRYMEQQDKMVSTAQECGRKYAKWLKAQGRNIQIRENND